MNPKTDSKPPTMFNATLMLVLYYDGPNALINIIYANTLLHLRRC